MKTKGVLLIVFLVVGCCLMMNGVSAKVLKTSSSVIYPADLKMDKKDRPHILFFDSKLTELFYAVKKKKWNVEKIAEPTSPMIGLSCYSLALNEKNEPYVLYNVAGEANINAKLYLKRKTGKEWKEELVKDDYGTNSCDIEINDNGKIFVIANRASNNSLRYLRLTKKGKIKSNKRLVKPQTLFFEASMALYDNKPRVVYNKINSKNFASSLRYAYRKNGKWRRKEVTDNKAYYPSLFFASDGVPYVTYNANHKVKIAWADDSRGEDWMEKALIVDYHGKNYYGYFDDDDVFHSTFAAVRDSDDTRLGFREYWKKSGQWQKKLRNSGKTYSTLTSIIPAINSLDNVYIVATQKSGKEYKIVYDRLK